MTDGPDGTVHVHDSFRCPAHARSCNCPDLENFSCNPYCDPEWCPDSILLMPGDEEAYMPGPSIMGMDGKTYGPGGKEVIL
jgi:hypothetical protein